MRLRPINKYLKRSRKAVVILPLLLLTVCLLSATGQFTAQPVANAPANLRVDLLRYPADLYKQGYRLDSSIEQLHFSNTGSVQFATVNSRFPGFSWVDPATIQRQTAFQIRVAGSRQHLQAGRPDIWNSGKVNSHRNVNVIYKGPPLKPGTIYFWQVRVWQQGRSTHWSAIQAFKTGSDLSDYALPSCVLTKTSQLAAGQKSFGNNNILYDFGKDGFGQPIIEVNARNHADTLTLRLAEMLRCDGHTNQDPPGTVRYRKMHLPLRKGRHTYAVALTPDKRNTGPNAVRMPRYIGEVLPFRYLEISGDLTHNHIEKVSRALIHIPQDDQSTEFTSSDNNLNRVWELCKYTIKATSFTGYYVDGDRERTPYEADALINQLSHYSTDAGFNMAKRTLAYLIYHPTWPTEWSLQDPLIACYDYMYSGDERNLQSLYPELKPKVLTALEQANGLISTRTAKQLPEFLKSIHYKVFDGNEGLKDIVDWPHTQKETDGFVFTDFNAVVNAFYYGALRAMATIADHLQKPEEAAFYLKKAAGVKKAFVAHLIDPVSGLVMDGIGTDHHSLHANMFAMAFDLIPQEDINPVLTFIKSRGLACSVYGAQFLLEALGRQDRSDYALQLLTSTGKRSWINMLREGATMTMEAWGQQFKPNQDWNHAWGTAPANYIVRYLMGIQPAAPGFERITVRPHPGRLERAQIKYNTIKGTIQVRFQNDTDRFRLWLSVPGNAVAQVYLPAPDNNSHTVIEMDGRAVPAVYEKGYWSIRSIPSGRHIFVVHHGESATWR